MRTVEVAAYQTSDDVISPQLERRLAALAAVKVLELGIFDRAEVLAMYATCECDIEEILRERQANAHLT